MNGTANPGRSKAKYAARGVHLDQDTAGRLLESVGDHARREMIVRIIFWWSDKTRLIDRLLAPGTASRESSWEAVHFLLMKPGVVVNRSAGGLFYCVIAALGAACGSSRSAPPEIGTIRAADVPIASMGPWAFSHSPGTREYQISRSAKIQGWTDSVSREEVVSNLTREILTLESTGEGLTFKAVVEKFDLNTQGAVGPAQSIQLPIELSGTLGPAGIRMNGSTNGSCNAIRSVAMTDLYNLLAPFPAQLTRGMTWRDSINVSGCQAGIPTTTATRRVFKVDGEVVHDGRPRLLLTRMDTLVSRGTGAYDQHRMELGGTGSGSALYYLDPASGEVSHLITVQSSQIRVTTSGRIHAFTQLANQEFVRVR